MKCILDPTFENVSGKMGGLVFRTYKKPDGTKETRVYGMPKRRDGRYGYERKTKPSQKELDARSLFARRQAFEQGLLASGKYHSKTEAWKIAKQQIK